MNVTFAPKGIVQIDDCRIIFRNFSGAPSKYNRAGGRNFAVVIPDEETANDLIAKGWNVRVKPPRDEDEEPLRYLPVKIKFNDHSPVVYLRTGTKKTRLDEENVDIIDSIDILSVDLDIRPYNWEMDGKTGQTAYLTAICVTQAVDRFYEEDGTVVEGNAPF